LIRQTLSGLWKDTRPPGDFTLSPAASVSPAVFSLALFLTVIIVSERPVLGQEELELATKSKNSGADRKEKDGLDRGAKDDWEALKIVLDELPSLKQRVLHKLRELKKRKSDGDIKVSRKEQKDYLREKQREKSK